MINQAKFEVPLENGSVRSFISIWIDGFEDDQTIFEEVDDTLVEVFGDFNELFYAN